jgi:mRNA-degrading endonuclease RelE of RelBE toxin-antitoxin system
VIFVETPTFTRRVLALLNDDEYREIQSHLTQHPGAGTVIPGSGGLRKLRWAGSGRGKRGGLRVIYYWWSDRDRISMLVIYRKNEQDDLTPNQVKLLRRALGL